MVRRVHGDGLKSLHAGSDTASCSQADNVIGGVVNLDFMSSEPEAQPPGKPKRGKDANAVPDLTHGNWGTRWWRMSL